MGTCSRPGTHCKTSWRHGCWSGLKPVPRRQERSRPCSPRPRCLQPRCKGRAQALLCVRFFGASSIYTLDGACESSAQSLQPCPLRAAEPTASRAARCAPFQAWGSTPPLISALTLHQNTLEYLPASACRAGAGKRVDRKLTVTMAASQGPETAEEYWHYLDGAGQSQGPFPVSYLQGKRRR